MILRGIGRFSALPGPGARLGQSVVWVVAELEAALPAVATVAEAPRHLRRLGPHVEPPDSLVPVLLEGHGRGLVEPSEQRLRDGHETRIHRRQGVPKWAQNGHTCDTMGDQMGTTTLQNQRLATTWDPPGSGSDGTRAPAVSSATCLHSGGCGGRVRNLGTGWARFAPALLLILLAGPAAAGELHLDLVAGYAGTDDLGFRSELAPVLGAALEWTPRDHLSLSGLWTGVEAGSGAR